MRHKFTDQCTMSPEDCKSELDKLEELYKKYTDVNSGCLVPY